MNYLSLISLFQRSWPASIFVSLASIIRS